MKEFDPGTIISSYNNKSIVVLGYLAEGAQGKIYNVKINESSKVLKWLDKSLYARFVNAENYRDHVRRLVTVDLSCDNFVLPIDVTEIIDGEFGYLMNPIPIEYKPAVDFLNNVVNFPNYQILLNALLQLLSAMRILHAKGYVYGDLNDNNVFINPQTGDVRICDTDGISSNIVFSGVRGNPRYTAPEVIKDYTKRTAFSDRFALYSLMFCMICHLFPFEEQSVINSVQNINDYYYNPVFVFDQTNDINRPDPNKQKTSIELWEGLPDYIKTLFDNCFNQTAISKPSKRPTELIWINALLHWKNDIIECDSCHREFFGGTVCPVCHAKKEVRYSLRDEDVSIPAVYDKKIYNTSIGFSNPLDGITPVARIVKKKTDSSILGLENCSHIVWSAVSTKKENKTVLPGHIIPLKNGIEIDIKEKKYRIDNM